MSEPLFVFGRFTSAAGLPLDFKIECDVLTYADWECLAYIAAQRIEPFRGVGGVATGGLKFAGAMEKYADTAASRYLVVDDVLTTGKSMEEFRQRVFPPPLECHGLVAFARGPVLSWVHALWTLSSPLIRCYQGVTGANENP